MLGSSNCPFKGESNLFLIRAQLFLLFFLLKCLHVFLSFFLFFIH